MGWDAAGRTSSVLPSRVILAGSVSSHRAGLIRRHPTRLCRSPRNLHPWSGDGQSDALNSIDAITDYCNANSDDQGDYDAECDHGVNLHPWEGEGKLFALAFLSLLTAHDFALDGIAHKICPVLSLL